MAEILPPVSGYEAVITIRCGEGWRGTLSNGMEFYCYDASPDAEIYSQHDFRNGLKFGYPTCCVLDYVCDEQHGRLPATLRPRIVAGDSTYVLCRRCAGMARG